MNEPLTITFKVPDFKADYEMEALFLIDSVIDQLYKNLNCCSGGFDAVQRILKYSLEKHKASE